MVENSQMINHLRNIVLYGRQLLNLLKMRSVMIIRLIRRDFVMR